MAGYYYSAALCGFVYEGDRPAFEAGAGWPDDAVAITDRWYNILLDGQTKGRKIVANSYGQPVLADFPAPTDAELIASAEARKSDLMQAAADAIAPLQDAVELGMATDGEAARLMGWKKYRVLLNRVDLSRPVWPEVPSDVA